MLMNELKFAVCRSTPKHGAHVGSYIYNSAVIVTINVVYSLLRRTSCHDDREWLPDISCQATTDNLCRRAISQQRVARFESGVNQKVLIVVFETEVSDQIFTAQVTQRVF